MRDGSGIGREAFALPSKVNSTVRRIWANCMIQVLCLRRRIFTIEGAAAGRCRLLIDLEDFQSASRRTRVGALISAAHEPDDSIMRSANLSQTLPHETRMPVQSGGGRTSVL